MSQRRSASPFVTAACLAVSAAAALLAPVVAVPAERSRTEAELKAVAAQIEKVRQQVRRDAIEKDRLARDLAAAEGSVSEARGELERLRRERGQREQARAALAAEKRVHEKQLGAARESLADQVRAAYLGGPREPLRLLLDQDDPSRAGRMLTYYGYLGRARAAEMARIDAVIVRIADDESRIAAEDAELERLEAARQSQLADLESARRQRSKVLANLTQESRDRAQNLDRLTRQQAALEKLLKDLNRALEDFPVDSNAAFARLRGQLAWPVAGRISARFGDTRAGGVHWNGMMIAAERGAPVKAVSNGRVAYADWLPGLGQLLIVDHGGGYLSLYGHNERLYKTAGADVKAGETIAAAGDSGGRSQPELYFEIRRAGKPVDPQPWFRMRNPP